MWNHKPTGKCVTHSTLYLTTNKMLTYLSVSIRVPDDHGAILKTLQFTELKYVCAKTYKTTI